MDKWSGAAPFSVFKALISAAAFFSTVFLFAPESSALPFFARQIGRDCTYCHSLVPKLNETGRSYRANGYRFAGEGEWKDVKDWTMIPASFEVEAEGIYNSLKSGGVKTESSDLKIEEAEVSAGGALGKSGKVSALVIIAAGQTDTGTDTRIAKGFIQVNDLAGPQGEGRLNVRAGQWDLGLPFLRPLAAPIANRYLSESAMNVLTAEQRAIEINGLVLPEEDKGIFSHHWALGLSREDVNKDDKLKGYYALYSATFNEIISLGAIYRGGREKNGAQDVSYGKYGAAAEAEAGPVILTFGYFRSERRGLPDRGDYLAEALYKPLPRISLGARYDRMKESGRQGVRSQSIMARYNILSNVYTQAEYRRLSDEGRVTSGNERENRVRVFLAAVF